MLKNIREFSLPRLLLICSLGLITLDIANSIYFIKYWEVAQLSEKMMAMTLAYQNLNWFELDNTFRQELIGIANQTAAFILVIFLIINSFFCFYLYQRKRWAWHYAVSYSTTASVFTIMTALENVPVGLLFNFINWLCIPGYALIGLLVWARKNDCHYKRFKLLSMIRE
jgi:hypothetical protein